MPESIRFNPNLEPRLSASIVERLVAKWNEEVPDAFEATHTQNELRHSQIEAQDAFLASRSIKEVLAIYGVKDVTIREQENGWLELQVNSHFSDDRLPEGYGYKGGAARALLLRALGIDSHIQPRDIDILRFTEHEPESGLDLQLEEHYMPVDSSHGHGIDTVVDKENYFATRDLTLNEVLATDTEITATRACIVDSVRHIIRATKFETDDYGEPNPKVLIKMIRFYAEAINRYDQATLVDDISEYRYEEYFMSPFWLGLHLDRAYEQSPATAELYLRELLKRDQLPQDCDTLSRAAKYLLETMIHPSFYYRHAPIDQFEDEDKWESLEQEYDSGPVSKRSRAKSK